MKMRTKKIFKPKIIKIILIEYDFFWNETVILVQFIQFYNKFQILTSVIITEYYKIVVSYIYCPRKDKIIYDNRYFNCDYVFVSDIYCV